MALQKPRIRLVGKTRRRFVVPTIAAMVFGFVSLVEAPNSAAANPCGPPVVSVIACENSQTGDPASDWQVSGAGDSTIQGFATSISVDQYASLLW